jgi:predicted Zn-dependent protease
MSQLTVSDWKSFLEARIEQEQGKDESALARFESLLGRYPDNPHLLASRTFALQRLGRAEEAAASQIAAKYAELGRTLVGEKDQPEVWTSQLQATISELDDFQKSGKIASVLMAW